MNVQKFVAANTRAALHKVRLTLGEEALILSNREVAEGVEIMAMSAAEVVGRVETRPVGLKPDLQDGATGPAVSPLVEKTAALDQQAGLAKTLIDEIRAMQGMIAGQLTQMQQHEVWQEAGRQHPGLSKLLREFLLAGFSPALARKLLSLLPAKADAQPPHDDLEAGRKWLQAMLIRNLATAKEGQMIAQGGVYALIGPTGAGKTTTTAKLAARAVMHYGAGKVALVTTDSYRIGAHEQLRIYGKILGVPVHAVKDTDDLRVTLLGLAGKSVVLIDTIGMSQRDRQVQEQALMLHGASTHVKKILLLNATSSGDTLDEVVRAYRGDPHGNGAQQVLHGCIMTKIDEAASLGAVLDVLIRHRLTLHYVANGQRVPEDLHAANATYLVHRAFKTLPQQALRGLQEDELSSLMVPADAPRAP